jgi:tetratricopeptide (TPR) repeat protein
MSRTVSPLVVCLWSTITTSAAVPIIADAQTVALESSDPRIARAEELHFANRAAESLKAFEDVVVAEPENYEALWKTAMANVVVGLLADEKKVQNQWYVRGEEYARRAVETEPDGIDGLYWLVSAKGLRAVQTGALDASRLGTEVYQLGHRLLEMDSLHAGAYHALGVLYYEVQKLNIVKRFIATRILGNRVFQLTSWETAERYLRRATELEPDFVLFRLDLGKLYLERGQRELARQAFQRVIELRLVHPPDPKFQETAARLLATIS